jgi:hypothetical protein
MRLVIQRVYAVLSDSSLSRLPDLFDRMRKPRAMEFDNVFHLEAVAGPLPARVLTVC